uniref:Uncharacterized protein n=1 Tax=viral metagenome TaxID=1070528 RepID=A0A6C0EYV5_9ZZZZ
MFYYLLYNSSFSFIVENRLFSTVLYGSILYILSHAVLNYCGVSILSIINNYYWTLFVLDVSSVIYSIYQSITNGNEASNGSNNSNDNNNKNGESSNSLNVSFNLLKNKINTILDRKNDLTITHIPIQNNQTTSSQSASSQSSSQSARKSSKQISAQINNTNIDDDDPLNILPDFEPPISISPASSNQFSTPINRLKGGNKPTTQSSSNNSTPLNLIRGKANNTEPIINEFDNNNNNYAESNASDLGSVMDLEDFETSL